MFIHERWEGLVDRLEWSNMTAKEEAENQATFLRLEEKKKERDLSSDEYRNLSKEEIEQREIEHQERELEATKKACEAECGVTEAVLLCSGCKKYREWRYCSRKCQQDDWKVCFTLSGLRTQTYLALRLQYHKIRCGKKRTDSDYYY